MYKIKEFSKIILADHIFLIRFQYMLSIGVINMDINIAVELCKNANAINREIRFYLFPFALRAVYCVFSSLQMGRVVVVKLKNVMLSHYIITTPWMTGCLLVWPYVISLPLGQRINGHEEVGGWPEVTCWLHAHACIPKRCVQSWMPASVPASNPLCWRVSLIKQELHDDREQRSSECSFCYNKSPPNTHCWLT